jgi:mono/diheme cytochrome c family protein
LSRPLRLVAAVLSIVLSASTAWSAGDPERGEYLLHAGGCAGCHTVKDGPALAGGVALASPVGTFHVPNITPDPETGIGGWSEDDFVRAMSLGIAPDGTPYYPAFPYPFYTHMAREDVLDLKAYLDTVEPVRNAVRDHGLTFPFSVRGGLHLWQAAFFAPGPLLPVEGQSDAWERGRYLVNGPGHCGACHTPMSWYVSWDSDGFLAGTRSGPDGKPVPSIAPTEDGIGDWSPGDVVLALQTGFLPDGDVLGGLMSEVVRNTGKLSQDDLQAIAAYLLDADAPRP